ncbi:MAG: LptF/LptG family permease [Brevinematia bacterium]
MIKFDVLKKIIEYSKNFYLKSRIKEALTFTIEYIKDSFRFGIIQKYVIKQFLLVFVASSIFLTLLAVVFNLVMDLNWFLSKPDVLKTKFNYIMIVYVLKGPQLYSYLAPLCILLSISYTISRMSRNFELIAIVNAGMSLRKLFAPMINVIIVISILYFFFLDQVVTLSGKESRTIERVKIWEETSFIENQVISDITTPIKSLNKAITYTEIGFLSIEGKMENVKINKFFERTGKIDFESRKFEGGLVEYKISAKYAKWDKEINNWRMYDVEILEFNEKSELISRKYLKEFVPNFKLDPPSFFFPKKYDFNYLTLSEMAEEINKSSSIKVSFEGGNYYQKLMIMLSRPSISFSIIISGLLALGFVKVISRNLTFINMVFQSIIRYVVYFISFLGGMWLGENRILPPIIAIWLPNIIFLSYSIYLNSKIKT